MITYKNGNRVIRIDPVTGYKERLVSIFDINTEYKPYRPESLDINLSYRCSIGCEFCYLNATSKGREFSFDKEFLNSIFEFDITGMEIALNFNEGQDYEMTKKVIDYFKSKGAIPNITVNYITFISHYEDIISLGAYHIGISVSNADEIIESEEIVQKYNLSVVYHIINGVFKDIDKVSNVKILILGYKFIGRGKKFSRENEIEFFTEKDIQTLSDNGCVIAFDNLAIEQLNIEVDDLHYLGDDGEISFYIDLVTKKFGKSSTEVERFNIDGMNVIEMFTAVKEKT